MKGYYFAIYNEETVIVKYDGKYLFMCGTDEVFAENEFDDIDFENCIHFL